MQLLVGTNSTWSLRAWMGLKLLEMPFETVVFDIDYNPEYKQRLSAESETALVPVLKHGKLAIHDSLAILEYLNEMSAGSLYPRDVKERAYCRSLCAELHDGFKNLRERCPFTLEPVSPVLRTVDMNVEIKRLESIFSKAEGPFMFGTATAVDVYYAVMAFRLYHYSIGLDESAVQYQQQLLDWSLLKSALDKAKEWEEEVYPRAVS